ncbi:MAG: carboxylating nicotinate-nucleotide diphosphorylase [Oscillospiraceae bacterium]|jgi:nicotinate-nucleotide pyrophosphorylase (carboxylating)|nr:carboxylating nicotinate-nucleotide diphosphorylase [Oscillospiraceae bacterium]
MNPMMLDDFLRAALREDMPFGDLSSESVFDEAHTSRARLVAKADGVLCGMDLFFRVFALLGDVHVDVCVKDATAVQRGDVLAEFSGRTRTLLAGERTALNLLQHLSGIATATARAVSLVEGTGAIITETRKTLPGLRALQKYAVRCGGGRNHRFSLSEAVMLKDNHIDAAGGMAAAIEKVRAHIGHMVKIEVETRTLDEVAQAQAARADVIMLDNMSLEEMRAAVALIDHRVPVEASGNITHENLRRVAETGVDVISLGALTHSVNALDISMQIGWRN